MTGVQTCALPIYENRQIRIFVLGKKEDKFSPTISEFKVKDEEHLAVKMSRFGGE